MSIAVNGPRRIERGLTTLVTGFLVIGLSACTGGAGGLNGSPDQPPLTLTVSEAYTQANPDEARKQLTQLQGAIDRLRKATSSGWTGRQDDETGYLAELSGGRYSTGAASVPGVVGAFFGDYGLELFGIGIAELELEVPAAAPPDGTTIVRAAQLIAGVPVLDGELQLTITSSDAETRLNTVRGRVFPGLQLSTTPTISAARATQVIRRLSGAEVPRAPQLVVVPEGFGVLAWQATAVGNSQTQGGTGLPTNANYFIDAATGEVVTIRAGSAHADIAYRGGNRADETVTRHSVSTAPSVGEKVEVTGNNQLTGPITAVGTVRNDGLVTLKDTSVPSYDAGTGAGGIETYDASGVSSDEDLPGQVITSTSAEIDDGDAIAAHAYARFVYDYYGELGRLSWDGAGGTLVSAVNFGPPDFCNAFFSSDLVPPQMVYGETCTVDGIPQATARSRYALPSNHPRSDRQLLLAHLLRPGGRAQRELLGLLRQHHREPLVRQRQRRLQRAPLRGGRAADPDLSAQSRRNCLCTLPSQRQHARRLRPAARTWVPGPPAPARRPGQCRRPFQLRGVEQLAVVDSQTACPGGPGTRQRVRARARLRQDRLPRAHPTAGTQLRLPGRSRSHRGDHRGGRREPSHAQGRSRDLRTEPDLFGLRRPALRARHPRCDHVRLRTGADRLRRPHRLARHRRRRWCLRIADVSHRR